MALLDFSNTNQQQSTGGGGLLNSPLALTGMMLLAQQNEDIAQMLPGMMQMQQTQALNQYRQQQAAHQTKEYDLQERKYYLDVSKQQQEVAKQERYKTAEQRLAELRGNKGQAPEQAGAIFRPDSTIYTGSGYEGGQLTPEQLRLRQAEVMAGLGDTGSATNLYDEVTQPFTLSPGQTRLDAQGNVIASGGVDKTKVFENANKLRDEFVNQSKDFVKVNDAYGRILVSANKPSAAGDLSLIFNYMKMLDPGSTVREGEFATAQNSGGVPTRLVAQYNKLLRGERLSDIQRGDFVNRSGSLYQSQLAGQEQIENQYRGIAQRSQLNPEDVIINYRVSGRGDKAQPQYNAQQLQSMAQQAIAQGADPEQVKQRMMQMRGGNG